MAETAVNGICLDMTRPSRQQSPLLPSNFKHHAMNQNDQEKEMVVFVDGAYVCHDLCANRLSFLESKGLTGQ
jgi:hypothetical protein